MLAYLIAWLGLVILAIINGAIREFTYQKYTGEHIAHQISTFTLIIFMTVYSIFILSIWQIPPANVAIIIGLIWLILTLAFEFGFGHYISKKSWEVILKDYNIFKGRLWIIIPIGTAIVPLLHFKFFY